MARLRVLLLTVLSCASGCSETSAAPATATPSPAVEEAPARQELARLLPTEARVFLEAPNIAALDPLVGADLSALRGAALAEYPGLGTAIVLALREPVPELSKLAERDEMWNGTLAKHELRQPQRLGEYTVDTLLVAGSNHVVIACSEDLVEAIDAVVDGTAPSLNEDSRHLAKVPSGEGLLAGYVTAQPLPLLDNTVSIDLVARPRLRLDVSVPTTEPIVATSVTEMVRRLPADTVAFEAHAVPARVHAWLQLRLGENLLTKQLGFDAAPLLRQLGGRGVVGLVAAPPDQGSLKQAVRDGVVFAVHDVEDPAVAEDVLEATRGIELDGGRVLVVEIQHDQLWISVGPPELSKRVQRDYFFDEPTFRRTEVLAAVADRSFALWLDDDWLGRATGVDEPLIRRGAGDPMLTVQVAPHSLHASIDVALVEDLVLLAMRSEIESWFSGVLQPERTSRGE